MFTPQACRIIVCLLLCLMPGGRLSAQQTAPPPASDQSLIAAVKSGNIDAVSRLLKQGADPNTHEILLTKPSLSENVEGGKPLAGDTALMLAVQHGHAPIVKLLLRHGAKVNKAGPFGFTPLIEAARFRKREIARILLAHGAKPQQRNASGDTALVFAINERETTMIDLLLEHGADINGGEKTPLMHAVSFGNAQIVRLLLEKGAKPNVTSDYWGSALDVAIDQNQPEIAQILRKSGGKQTLTPAQRKERAAKWQRFLAESNARQQANLPKPETESVLLDEDKQVIETMLLDLLAYKGEDLYSFHKNAPDIVLVNQVQTAPARMEEQINAELNDRQANDITLEMRRSLFSRRSDFLTWKAFSWQSSHILVWDKEKFKETYGQFRKEPETIKAWVQPFLPGYSKQRDQAVLRFWFGPTPHGASGTYFLVKRAGKWRVQWRDFAFYV